jgi:lambda family phage portal protein
MSWLQKINPFREKKPTHKRSNAGSNSRLFADWITNTRSGNADIFSDLKTVRNRSRDLEQNNDYAEKFYKILENNVLGHAGITLQMKSKDPNGNLDKNANSIVENAWFKWGKKEFASIDGCDSWLTQQKLALRSTARDGGCFVRKITGADNDFGFSLQLIEADFLDIGFNGQASNGNQIVMGIELGFFKSGKVTYKKPVAYWFFKSHPGDVLFRTTSSNLSLERIPAEEIIHTFKKRRIGDVVGYPWMAVSMSGLKMLDGYEEAALVAAREGACKGGFITKTAPVEFQGDDSDTDGNKITNLEPGEVRELEMGQGFQQYDPKHPMNEYPSFVKARLRRLAAGLGVSYNTLANDLEGVNYSSIRAGLLDERDEWKGLQEWFIDIFISEVFYAWLPMAILSGQIALPMAKLEKFQAAEWKARRWGFVDPLKDINAKIIAINNGLESRRSVIAEGGGDVEDLFREISEDQNLADEYDLKFGSTKEEMDKADALIAVSDATDSQPSKESK